MQLTGWETIFFYGLGAWALFTAIVVVTARNAVHSALALISTLVTVAGVFLLCHAEFLAGVQVLVYVGGVMVLFLFVIMLVNVDRENRHRFTKQTTVAYAVVILLAAAFSVAVHLARPVFTLAEPGRVAASSAEGTGVSKNTEEVGLDLYQRAALPFEIASVVLLVAIVGAVLLARERKQERMFD